MEEKTYLLNFCGDERYDIIRDQMTYSQSINSYNEMSWKLFANKKEMDIESLEFLHVFIVADLTDTQRWFELMNLVYKISLNCTVQITIVNDSELTANQLFFAKKVLYNLKNTIQFVTTNENNISMNVFSLETLKSIIELD